MSDSLNSGTTAVREQFQFDVQRLQAWMESHVEDFKGPLSVAQFKGGQSNPTYKLTTPKRNYVLRRKPPGATLPGAHAVDREARIQSALFSTRVPVTRIFVLCTDNSIIGSWFYIMEHVDGRIFWDARLPQVEASERPAYFDAMIRALAALHQVDYRACGLEDYGKAGNYFARQIARWSRQYQADPRAGTDPNIDRLIEWLPENIPDGEERTILHGDFRIDNMVFHPTKPRILAILDWELSTIGHPLADFAYHLMMYRMPPLLIAGLAGTNFVQENIPTEAEYIAAYCRHTGRKQIEQLNFYLSFNMFRLATIIHGIKGRMLNGTAASAHADKLVDSFPLIAATAWSVAHDPSSN